jgi:hypothetical protein
VKNRIAGAWLLAALLVGCGGGGGGESDNDPAPDPGPTSGGAEGYWVGAKDSITEVFAIVLPDGRYWVVYNDGSDPNDAEGIIYGTGVGSEGTFTSTDGIDVHQDLGRNVDLSIAYTEGVSISADAQYSGEIEMPLFGGAYQPQSSRVADPAEVAGTWSGQLGATFTTLTISGAGALSGVDSLGCNFTGTVLPRDDLNAFDVDIDYDETACLPTTAVGAAVYDRAAEQLIVGAMDDHRPSAGLVFIGKRVP